MIQLILPIEELLADSMEEALTYRWLVDWGFNYGYKQFADEYLGQWARCDLHFLDLEHFKVLYDPELFLHVNRNRPWLQLYLPYPVHGWVYTHEDADTLLAIESDLDLMRESCGLEPRFRGRVRPPDRELLDGSSRFPDPHDRFINGLLRVKPP